MSSSGPFFDEHKALEQFARRLAFLRDQVNAATDGLHPSTLRILAVLLLEGDVEAAAVSEMKRLAATFASQEEGCTRILVALQVLFGDGPFEKASEQKQRIREIREAFLGQRDPSTVRTVK